VYAGALYGVEAAQATPQTVARLSAAVIDAFKSRNNDHNANWFFTTMSPSRNDLDPMAQIFCRRVMQIRRRSCKREGAKARFKSMLNKYAETHKQGSKWPKWYHSRGTEEGQTKDDYPVEQPHPSTREYEAGWDKPILPLGPIGLLVESLIWHGMAIDDDFKIWQSNEEPIDMFNMTYQSLKPMVLLAAGRARTKSEWNRTGSTNMARGPIEIDNEISQVNKKLSEEEQGIIRTVLAGGNQATKRRSRIQPRLRQHLQLLPGSRVDGRPHLLRMQIF
jgi:hypothetical protein